MFNLHNPSEVRNWWSRGPGMILKLRRLYKVLSYRHIHNPCQENAPRVGWGRAGMREYILRSWWLIYIRCIFGIGGINLLRKQLCGEDWAEVSQLNKHLQQVGILSTENGSGMPWRRPQCREVPALFSGIFPHCTFSEVCVSISWVFTQPFPRASLKNVGDSGCVGRRIKFPLGAAERHLCHLSPEFWMVPSRFSLDLPLPHFHSSLPASYS